MSGSWYSLHRCSCIPSLQKRNRRHRPARTRC
nr:MAG TPA: hypothetical protein [Caudoviricetes sp.]